MSQKKKPTYFPSFPETKTAFPEKPIIAYHQPKNLCNLLVRADISQHTHPIGQTHFATKRDVKHVPFYQPILHAQLPQQGKLTHYRYKPRARCPTLSTCFSAIKCSIQYVGETSQQLNERINSHRSDIRRKSKVNQLLLFSTYPATQLTNSVMIR